MTKLDWDRARRRPARERQERPVGPYVRRTRARKRYRTLKHAEAAAAYLNEYGKQRDRYVWTVGPHLDDPECFELFTTPREPARVRVGTATQPQR